jgi:uncharacterized protein
MNPVDVFIDGLPLERKALVEQLRHLIHTLVPGVQEKLSFKIPFYHYFGMFCYINPVKDGFDLGICNGKKIAADFEHLEVKGRALIATVRLHTLKDIETKQVAEILTTAAIDKEAVAKEKKQKRPSKR